MQFLNFCSLFPLPLTSVGVASAGKASSTVASLSTNPKMEQAQMSSAMAQSEIGKAKLVIQFLHT